MSAILKIVRIGLAAAVLPSSSCSGGAVREGCIATPSEISAAGEDAPYEFYHLRMYADHRILWNKQPVNEEDITLYMDQLNRRPKDAGKLSIEVDPASSCEEANHLLLTLSRHRLCKAGRCVLSPWDVKEPIVN